MQRVLISRKASPRFTSIANRAGQACRKALTKACLRGKLERTTAAKTLISILGLTCLFGALPAQAQSPSFYKDVAPILRAHCQSCHRPGEIAPMPLITWHTTWSVRSRLSQRLNTKPRGSVASTRAILRARVARLAEL